MNRCSGEGKAQELHFGLAADVEPDLGPGPAAHTLDRSFETFGIDCHIVNRDHDVAWLDAGLGRRRILEWRDDHDLAVADIDIEPDTGVVSGRGDTDVLVLVPVEIPGMLVQPVDHSADGIGNELLLVDGVDIFIADPRQRFGDERQAGIVDAAAGSGWPRLAVGQHRAGDRNGQTKHGADDEYQNASHFQ